MSLILSGHALKRGVIREMITRVEKTLMLMIIQSRREIATLWHM